MTRREVVADVVNGELWKLTNPDIDRMEAAFVFIFLFIPLFTVLNQHALFCPLDSYSTFRHHRSFILRIEIL